MKAFKLLVAPALFAFCCSTARADLTINSVGAVQIGNSWSVPVTLFNPGTYDLIVVEVIGDTFEALPPAIVTSPGSWTGAWVSSGLLYASGPAFTGLLDLFLTFDAAAAPTTTAAVTVSFSAFTPGAETASAVTGMTWNGIDGFTYPVSVSVTSQTRSGLVYTPVPGAFFLGMIGLGLVGLARKRLR